MPRHSLVVRLTHWINAVASFALIVNGIAIRTPSSLLG